MWNDEEQPQTPQPSYHRYEKGPGVDERKGADASRALHKCFFLLFLTVLNYIMTSVLNYNMTSYGTTKKAGASTNEWGARDADVSQALRKYYYFFAYF